MEFTELAARALVFGVCWFLIWQVARFGANIIRRYLSAPKSPPNTGDNPRA